MANRETMWQDGSKDLSKSPNNESRISDTSVQPLLISLCITGAMVFLMAMCFLWEMCIKRVRLNAVRMQREKASVEKGSQYETTIFKTPSKLSASAMAVSFKGNGHSSEAEDSDEKTSLSDIDPQAAFSPYHLAWTTPMPGAVQWSKYNNANVAKSLFNTTSDQCIPQRDNSGFEDSLEREMCTINECSLRTSVGSQERTDPDGNSCEVIINSPDHMTRIMSKTGFTSGYVSQLSDRVSPLLSTPKSGNSDKIWTEGQTPFQTPRLNSTTSSDYVFSGSSQFPCNQTPIFSVPQNSPLNVQPNTSTKMYLDASMPCPRAIFRKLSSEEISTPLTRKQVGSTRLHHGATPTAQYNSSPDITEQAVQRVESVSGIDDSLVWDSFMLRSSMESLSWDDYSMCAPSDTKHSVSTSAYNHLPHGQDMNYLSISVVDPYYKDGAAV